jgi:hypothetical protein
MMSAHEQWQCRSAGASYFLSATSMSISSPQKHKDELVFSMMPVARTIA